MFNRRKSLLAKAQEPPLGRCPDSSATRKDSVEYARELVLATVAEIGRAESKAATILAGGGVLAAAGTSAAVSNAGHLSHLPVHLLIPVCIAVGSLAAALVSLGAATYPRIKASRGAITYFADVVHISNTAELKTAIAASVATNEDTVLVQLQDLSRLVWLKYLFIKIAFLFLVITLIASLASVFQVIFFLSIAVSNPQVTEL